MIRRHSFVAPVSLVALAALSVVVACTHPQEAAPIAPDPHGTQAAASSATATVSSAPEAVPTSDASKAKPDPPALADPSLARAWTDEEVVAALANECAWQPAQQEQAQPSPLSCQLEFEQSCVPDPCFDADQEQCKPACKKSCDTCGTTCTSSCETCKKTCTDPACRHSCAATCAECRQGCLRSKDQCTSGTCGKAYEECRKKLVSDWKTGPCKAVCPRVAGCASNCFAQSPSDDKCITRCQKLMGACPRQYFGMCVMAGGPGE